MGPHRYAISPEKQQSGLVHAALLTYDMLASAWLYERFSRFLGTESYVNGRGMHKAGLLRGRHASILRKPQSYAAYGDMIVWGTAHMRSYDVLGFSMLPFFR
ncbi:hypothetical protein KDAU_38880 [Dictyobacter aurantiacus]|uniref:Uncharacterized protein n=1 Tax=Dictyobacter aurantiacus TaxID=1936993 RepID=A0A401ZI86_9CHLR|nr:hypothetical protein KDAU_38880 [Dictyobacter aurantiacus]